MVVYVSGVVYGGLIFYFKLLCYVDIDCVK